LQTMAASGRLTEIGGAAALPLDREMRRLAIPWSAERKLGMLDSTTQAAKLLRAYGDGINAYIDQMSRDELPLEFRLLGKNSVPRWESLNSILLFNRLGWTLAYIVPELERALPAALGERERAPRRRSAPGAHTPFDLVRGAARRPRGAGRLRRHRSRASRNRHRLEPRHRLDVHQYRRGRPRLLHRKSRQRRAS